MQNLQASGSSLALYAKQNQKPGNRKKSKNEADDKANVPTVHAQIIS
jgi:hypothetical protein